MSDLLERLRGRGWRMTAQRRVVAEVLDGDHVHLTADEVHARAVAKLPEISRATVYNTLGEMVSLGEVIEVATDHRAKRYDPNAHHPHQHLVCGRCGAIRDVHPAGDPLADLPHGRAVRFHGLRCRGDVPRYLPELRRGCLRRDEGPGGSDTRTGPFHIQPDRDRACAPHRPFRCGTTSTGTRRSCRRCARPTAHSPHRTRASGA